MTIDEFAASLKEGFAKGFAQRFGPLIVEHALYDQVLDLGLDPDPRVAFRASYALEYAFLKEPSAFVRFHTHFIQNYLIIKNPSAQRHYAKIMAHLLRHHQIRLPALLVEPIVEVTFDRLIDPSVRPAVKVWAMEILYDLAPDLPWVDEQLYDTIQFLMQDETPALRSHGVKICRRIRIRQKGVR